jgi:hypothetical protein
MGLTSISSPAQYRMVFAALSYPDAEPLAVIATAGLPEIATYTLGLMLSA